MSKFNNHPEEGSWMRQGGQSPEQGHSIPMMTSSGNIYGHQYSASPNSEVFSIDFGEFVNEDDGLEPEANDFVSTNFTIWEDGNHAYSSVSQHDMESGNFTIWEDDNHPSSSVSQVPEFVTPTPGNDADVGGIEKQDENSGSTTWDQQPVAVPSHQQFPAHASHLNQSSDHMQTQSSSSIQPLWPMPHTNSPYPAYQLHFDSPEAAREYRRTATRFNRGPYKKVDDTILRIVSNRMVHVAEIYHAMVYGADANDNANAIARKRWVNSVYYDPALVEAHAHKVFDCLIEQVYKGFRGWSHNDYVTESRKSDAKDKNWDCEQRLGLILEALRTEKTICEDVMHSAAHIRMFVNAPKAYLTRKIQNRKGNGNRSTSTAPKGPHSKGKQPSHRPSTETDQKSSADIQEPASKKMKLELQPAETNVAGLSRLRPNDRSMTFAGSSVARPRPLAAPLMARQIQTPTLIQSSVLAHQRMASASPAPSAGSPSMARMPMMSPQAVRAGQDIFSGHVAPDRGSQFDFWMCMPQSNDQEATGLDANLFAQHPDAANSVLNHGNQAGEVHIENGSAQHTEKLSEVGPSSSRGFEGYWGNMP